MKVAVSVVLLNLFTTINTIKISSTPLTIRQIFDISPDGNYNYAFETENNIYTEEEGYRDDKGDIQKHGQYQYTAPNGEVVRTLYTADENGFHPQGTHLPTVPPLPSGSFSFKGFS